MWSYLFVISITAEHMRLFAPIKADPELCITVTAPVQLEIAGDVPDNISPLVAGLSFT